MQIKATITLLSVTMALISCTENPDLKNQKKRQSDSTVLQKDTTSMDEISSPVPASEDVNTGTVQPAQLVKFALSQQGIPYKYGSTDPAVGFDCSGFITYVFNHFKIAVPRSSADFNSVGREIDRSVSQPGDLILFTGTDSTDRTIGHMGIIVSAPPDSIKFVHSTSGKAYGVTVTALNPYYEGRFVKIIRVFRDPERK